jgi:prophage regulatory protein
MAHAVLSSLPVKILRRPEVQNRTGLSRSTIYAKIGTNEFPKSIQLGRRAVGWLESDVVAWIRGRVRSSRKNGLRQSKSHRGNRLGLSPSTAEREGLT